MYMVMFVLDDPDYLDQILDSWSHLGISGATIIESTGLYRHHLRHIPMRYIYGESPTEERGNTTIFVIVENDKMTRLCLDAVEKIVGDLDGSNTGVFAAWPLSITKGVPSHNPQEKA